MRGMRGGSVLLVTLLVTLATLGEATSPCLTANTDKVTPGTTQELKLTCKARPEGTVQMVSSVTLFFTPGVQPTPTGQPAANPPPPAKETVATIYQGHIRSTRSGSAGFTVTGHAGTGNNDTVLEISIEYPSENDTGMYSCLFNGFDSNYMPVQGHDDKHVILKAATQIDVNEKVKEMQKDIKKMQHRWEAVDSSSVFIQVPGNYPGSRSTYLLSRSQVEHVSLCQFMCTVEGGYLAEIDDKAEFEFLQRFVTTELANEADYADVFISGTDHGHQNDWKFLHHHNRKPYLDWGAAQSQGYDCLILAKNTGYYMNDFDCNGINRFLCEIPQ